uniref:Uncharacterized protein n=1 Tax=Melanopsichium pennsylvanicum 4 TaxID=1398559 RepID=A0A077R508_9BASI|nr:uncharacterized protein BN887_06140 [Melanopsichium pennsylvanicum 4]
MTLLSQIFFEYALPASSGSLESRQESRHSGRSLAVEEQKMGKEPQQSGAKAAIASSFEAPDGQVRMNAL